MKRRSIVVANWKMNGDLALIDTMTKGLINLKLDENVDVILCPSSPYINILSDQICTDGFEKVHLGAQNVSEYTEGAYTGEVSAKMLQELNVKFVIVGHSERRSIFNETSIQAAQKVKQVLDVGLTPILCIGETENERELGKTETVLSEKLQAVIDEIGINNFTEVVVSYEPLWAIGTGKTASPEMAQDTHQFIRNFLTDAGGNVGSKVSILYGGSVNAGNCKELFAQTDIDGGLIGGASLKVDEFKQICLAAKGT